MKSSTWIREFISRCSKTSYPPKGYQFHHGLLLQKGMIVVVVNSPFKTKILHYIHNDLEIGHPSYLKTYQMAKRDFICKWMKKYINKIVRECNVFPQVKYKTTLASRLFQPLPIPQQSWFDLSMDFIEGLLKPHGSDVSMVVVDRFTKFGHFMPISHLYTTSTIVEVHDNS